MIILDNPGYKKNYRLQYLCSLNDNLKTPTGPVSWGPQGMKMNLEVVLAQPQLPVGQNQVRGFPTDLANGEPAFGRK